MKLWIASAILLMLFSSNLSADSGKVSSPSYSYYVVAAPLTELLTLISKDTGVDVEFVSKTTPYIKSTSISGSPEILIDSIAEQFNLAKFHFNGRTYISPAEEQQTRIVSSEAHSYSEIRAAIEKSGLNLEQFTVSETANPNALILTAPPKMVGIVEALVDDLSKGDDKKKRSEITLMRGI